MTSMGIELVCMYRGIAPGKLAEEMTMALFGRVHINMHMTMIDYTCIVAHDGLVPVVYDYWRWQLSSMHWQWQRRKHAAMHIWGGQQCGWGRHGQRVVEKHAASQRSPVKAPGKKATLPPTRRELFGALLSSFAAIEHNALLKKQPCSSQYHISNIFL